MQLLERESQLRQLNEAHASLAAGGAGLCVLISGEAGIGKTSLVQAFAQALPATTQLLQCGCEALFTPRPLGPWLDIATRFPPSLEAAFLKGAPVGHLFPELLRYFKPARTPSVLIVEDVHWADAGTLDLLHYLGRRLRELGLMMVWTHRSGIDAEHLLQRVLGDLPAATTLRMELPPLSAQAVNLLAGAARRDGVELYAATGGNPFYVAEALASPGGLPATVRDAVLAELARLDPAPRSLAQWVSLFPGRAERAVLDELTHADPAAVQAALRSGLLVADGATLAFRHEIARNAVYASLPAPQRADGHAAIHALLARAGRPGGGDDLARRVHHAEAAGLRDEVAALAPQAAAQAAATGAHREAARLYALALDMGAAGDEAKRAPLLAALADELMLVSRHREAIQAREEALGIHRARDELLRYGAEQRALARLHWFDSGSQGAGLRLAHEAIETLESLPPGAELALAYSTLSHLCLAGEDMAGAQLWGLRAVELAERIDSPEALCHALNNVACARLRGHDDPLAWDRLRRSLALAQQHGFEAEAARAYNNLFILSIVHHDLVAALGHAELGIAYCEARGLEVFNVRMRIRRAFAHLVMGRWDLADADLAEVVERHSPSPMEMATHGLVAAVLALRRGDDGAAGRLADATAAMTDQRVDIWFITTAAARAEAAWLAGDDAATVAAARQGLERMVAIGDRWRCSELAAWMQRAGAAVDLASLPPPPVAYSLELRGHWREAAEEWERLGCPYNRALALGRGDADALRQALAIFEALGAEPAAARMRAALRERGVRGVPRGPQPRTRDDPLGFTAREREVFDLLRRALSNAAIAARLQRSERTVEHHVTALLQKLGLSSRLELLARYGAGPTPAPPLPGGGCTGKLGTPPR